MKQPIKITSRQSDLSLELDSESEIVTLIRPTGEKIGSIRLDAILEFVQTAVQEDQTRRLRNYPRLPLAVRVTYHTPERGRFEGVTAEIGGGGLFVESSAPLKEGTEIVMEVVLPDEPTKPIRAKGKVAWVRPKQERYVFFPGMGVQFTEISDHARDQLLDMVKSLAHVRRGR